MQSTLRNAALAALIAVSATGADATVFTFATDPFAGTTVLGTPGRQVVGGELFIPDFDIDTDVLAFGTGAFNLTQPISFFSGAAGDIPASGANFVVLQTFDFDGDATNGVLLNAGLAADLVANAIDTPGAGFFIYFNSGLDLPRLVYSTDLSSSLSDLKIVARFTNFTGDDGRAQMPRFTIANTDTVPEPASWAMMIAGFGLVGGMARRRAVTTVTA
jgi:hypothetical protein